MNIARPMIDGRDSYCPFEQKWLWKTDKLAIPFGFETDFELLLRLRRGFLVIPLRK